MWNHPRPVRTEIISVNTGRLAQHAFAQMDFICVQAVPAEGHIKLSICTAHEWKSNAAAREYWFHSRRHATKVLDEMVTLEGMFWSAHRCDGGILVETSADGLDAVFTECLKWQPGIRLITREEIDARIASVKQQIDRSLVRLQSTGAMSTLNREYKALRARRRADGAKVPSYQVWATQRLEQQVLQLAAASL